MTSERRLLVVTESLGIGGTESHLLRVLPRISVLGWQVGVFCLSGRGDFAEDLQLKGVEVFPAKAAAYNSGHHRNALSVVTAASRLYRCMQRWRPQIAHFYLPGPYLVGTPIATASGIPVKIMSRRSLSVYQQKRPWVARLERMLHKKMDVLIGNSQAVVDQLKSEGANDDKVKRIYNGIDTLEPLPSRALARQAFGLNEHIPVAVVVANLIHYKGHEDLIKGLGQAARQLSSPWKVILAGRDHGLRPSLERLAQDLQIAENVEFIDQCSDVPRLLAAADLGLLTSHEEGFSNVVLESMAAALPMIVTDVGGNPEAVINEKTELVVPPHNPNAICDAFLRLVRAPELGRRYGTAARARVAQEFSLDRCVTAHAELYEELLLRVRDDRAAKSVTLRHPAPAAVRALG